MGKIQAPRSIRTEDFKAEEKTLIEKLSSSINTFQDDVYRLLNGGLDYSNMNRQLVEGISIVIDSAGKVSNSPSIKTSVKGRIKGVIVVFARNELSSSTYPTNTPFISYTLTDNLLTILSVTGLQNSSRYSLNIEILAQN